MSIPIISQEEFKQRRQHLLQQLGADHVAIISAAEHKIRNRDAEYAYRQDSDFMYLTGFNEPNAVLVLIPGREAGECVLFCQARDPKSERWTGRRAGVEGAVTGYGMDQAFPIAELKAQMKDLLANRSAIHYRMGADWMFDKQVLEWVNAARLQVRNGVTAPQALFNLDSLLHDMRLIKSAQEVTMMRYAASTSAGAHTLAMKQCQPGMMEYEVEAIFQHAFRRDGMAEAYTSIVGGGENACILHYVENNAVLQAGDLLLIDAGAEHQGYASDITRTFPVNGCFSPEQKALYQVVLDAQLAAIEAVKPGNCWDDPHQAALNVLVDGLMALGLLTESREKIMEDTLYQQFYMHKTGHWLGLDVHDVGDYKVEGAWRTLEPGMVLTVEPGLYISPADNVDEKWWNIGIRIEDDVLVTETGCEVLTHEVVKSIADIEWLMADTTRV